MKETSNKKYIAVMVLSVLCLAVIVGSVTYAYFTPKIEGEGQGVNVMAGKVKLQISETEITAKNLLPIRDGNKDRLAQKNEFTISRTDDSNLNACYSLYLVVDKMGSALKSKWFKYELDYVNTAGENATMEGTFEDFDTLNVQEDGTVRIGFLTNQELSNDVNSRSYTLRLWLSYSDDEDQTEILTGDATSRTFEAHIMAEGTSGKCAVQGS